MKKIISIFMIMVMLVSVFVIPVFATEYDTSNFKYLEKTVEYYTDDIFGDNYYDLIVCTYDEVYYHYSDDGTDEPDWALLYCVVGPAPTEMKYGSEIGNKVLAIVGCGCVGFSEGYAVYVRETDSIINLRQSKLEQIIELCPEFVESIEENNIGIAFGDVNENGEIDITDATYIQKHLADKLHYEYKIARNFYIAIGGGEYHVSIGDFNRDGDTTILDATAIQRKLAKLD